MSMPLFIVAIKDYGGRGWTSAENERDAAEIKQEFGGEVYTRLDIALTAVTNARIVETFTRQAES